MRTIPPLPPEPGEEPKPARKAKPIVYSLDDDEPRLGWWHRQERGVQFGLLGIAGFMMVFAIVVYKFTRHNDSGGDRTAKAVTASREPSWSDGNVSVAIIGATIADDDIYLIVSITSNNEKKNLSYSSWRHFGVRVKDNLGNEYKSRLFDPLVDGVLAARWDHMSSSAKLGYGAGPVYVEKGRAEFLVFDRPIKAAEYLDVDLDASHIGQTGTIRLRINAEAWSDPKKH